MGWLLVLAGIIMVLITAPEFIRQRKSVSYQQQDVELSNKLHALVQEKDSLQQQLQQEAGGEQLQERLDQFSYNFQVLQAKMDKWDQLLMELGKANEISFQETINQVGQMSLFDGIYTAYDQGKSIVDIARENNRGKGEIELILSLRK